MEFALLFDIDRGLKFIIGHKIYLNNCLTYIEPDAIRTFITSFKYGHDRNSIS